jgi:hypothetical protein
MGKESGPVKTLAGLVLLLASPLVLAGCAANRRQAGTGDVAFRLLWDGITDLDLFVQDPSGACIFFGNRQSQAGGILDVDCNGGSDFLCEVPIENIYWPSATAPAGEYLFWVHAHSLIPDEAPLAYRLQLLHGKEVFWLHTGTILNHEELHGPFVYRFPADKAASLFAGDSRPPLCAGRESGVLISH